MTPDYWNQAQSKNPIISQILEAIYNKTIGKRKLKADMDSDLKSFLKELGSDCKFGKLSCIEEPYQSTTSVSFNSSYLVNREKEP